MNQQLSNRVEIFLASLDERIVRMLHQYVRYSSTRSYGSFSMTGPQVLKVEWMDYDPSSEGNRHQYLRLYTGHVNDVVVPSACIPALIDLMNKRINKSQE